MTKAEDAGSTWWPSISSLEGAKKAAHEGAGAAVFVASVTGLLSVLAIFDIRILPGFSPWSLVDAVLFAIAAWRIYKLSRAWAVIGMLLFICERAYAFYARGATAMTGIVVGVIILLGFINGVRGTFAYHGFLSASQQSTDVVQK